MTENTQPHKDVGASLEPGQPVPPNELQSVEPDNNPTIITNVPLNISADTFASGMNSALQRTVSPATIEHDLKMIVRVMPTWKPPRKQKIETSGFVLPDAFDFIPKEPAKEDKPEKLKSIKPPGIVSGQEEDPTDGAHQVNGEKKKKTRTRLKPPADALSLKDRLFYLLQPPLEGWLGGQEMIMPFEPFPYQYEGIAWLFASQSALLADEMGLGKRCKLSPPSACYCAADTAAASCWCAPNRCCPTGSENSKRGPKRFRLWSSKVKPASA